MTTPAASTAVPAGCALPSRRALTVEVWIVLLLSIAASGIRALLSLIDSLTMNVPLNDQTVSNISSVTPDRPWLDLAYQLSFIVLPLVPVALVLYLLYRSGESARVIGIDRTQPVRDIVRGLILAAIIGISGLILYLVAFRMGLSVRIASVNLTAQWWSTPVLLLSALQNAVLEEVIVLAYLLHRLRQLGWRLPAAIASSAVLRGAYHLYQGFGGFVGNLAMGGIFGWLYYRWQRVMPFIIAHFVIDAVAFIGYSTLHGKVAWLP